MPNEESAQGLVPMMAEKYGLLPDEFRRTIKSTCFPKGDVSDEQLFAFLAIAREHDLNPFTREIFAFPRPGAGIQTIVSVDGWMKIINSHPKFDGMQFEDRFDPTGKTLVSITCRIYRKDRKHPIEATEYLTECMRPTDPWRQWPKRMLRHKAAIQAARYAFSFAGIVEPDECERQQSVEVNTTRLETPIDKVGEDLAPDNPPPANGKLHTVIEAIEEVESIPAEPEDRSVTADEAADVEQTVKSWKVPAKKVAQALDSFGIDGYEQLRVSQVTPFLQAVHQGK